MAESDNCLDETRLNATDVMLAKLTLSPCHTSTQLSVSADRPNKHGTKAKGEQKRQTHHFAYNSENKKADKPTAWCSAICVSCGNITNAWENEQFNNDYEQAKMELTSDYVSQRSLTLY